MAAAQVAAGLLPDALSTSEAALQVDPQNRDACALLITVLQRLGRFEEAIAACWRLASLDPSNYRPYCEVVRSRRVRESDGDLIEILQKMALEAGRSPADMFHIRRALGKAFDDLRNFDQAIAQFEQSNAIARGLVTAPDTPRHRELQVATSLFRAETFKNSKVAENADGPMPVLIVGMIRSGTTLLDSMLVRAEGLSSAGEVRYWNHRAGQFLSNPKSLQSESALREAGDLYLKELARSATAGNRVIDKMPMNFRHLGIAKLAVPSAKIIHLRRHPVDTAISIYTTDFGPQPPAFAFDRARIVKFYRFYSELMDHWRRVLPIGSFIEIDYEDLVTEPRPVIERVLSYLGVPWTESVLDRSYTHGDVNTPSRWQARQPIYSTSVGRWKNYYPWLGEFSELLTAHEVQSMNPETSGY